MLWYPSTNYGGLRYQNPWWLDLLDVIIFLPLCSAALEAPVINSVEERISPQSN